MNVTNLGVNILVKTAGKKDLLYKHAATIHKSNELTLLQNKISNVLYFNAYKELKTREVHEISIGDLCKQLSYKGHNDYEIKKSLKALISIVIEWDLLNDEKLETEDWTASTMLASASIKKGGICEYSYGYHMRELLSDSVLYGVINMAYQANFRSKYGLALYENCARFVNVKQTGWLEMDFFRELMGVAQGNYQIFRDFKRRVLDVAVNEVNTYSNLYVEPVFKKTGRTVKHIKFNITKKSNNKIPLANKDKEKEEENKDNLISNKINHHKELFSVLCRDFNLTEYQALMCLEKYSQQYVWGKIEYISSSKTKIDNISAYLLSALKHNYQKNLSYDQIKQRNIKTAQCELALINAQRFIQMIEKNMWSLSSIHDFLTRFKDYLRVNHNELYGLYLKQGINNDQIALTCMKFCKEKFNALYQKLINLYNF